MEGEDGKEERESMFLTTCTQTLHTHREGERGGGNGYMHGLAHQTAEWLCQRSMATQE